MGSVSKLPSSTTSWFVCGVLLLATLLNYMDRQALAVTLPTLKSEYHLAEGRVGMVEGCFGFAFAFGSLLFGWLADRWGPRWLYPAVLAGWSLAGMATGCAGQAWITNWLEPVGSEPGTGVYHWLLLCRIALGICEAGHWPCALLTVRAILPASDRPLGNGILQSGASLGAIIVPIYIEATDRAHLSWQFPFWSIGLLGLAWIPLWFFTLGRQNLRLPHGSTVERGPQAASMISAPAGTIRRLIVLAIIVSSLTISWQFLRAWQALFLQDYHGYSKEAARGLMPGFYIAADIGCILSGVWVTQWVRRGWTTDQARHVGYFVFTLLTACGALIPFAGRDALMVGLLWTAGAGILGLHPYYYALTQEISHARMGVISGALAALGWIVSSLWQIHVGQQIEATKSYQAGLIMVGLAPAVGCLALWTLWPPDIHASSIKQRMAR